MAVTPYDVARELYASNMMVAEQNALEVQQRLLEDYTTAKLDYQSRHQHYNSRGRIAPAAAVVASAPPPPPAAPVPYTVTNVLDYTDGVADAAREANPSGGSDDSAVDAVKAPIRSTRSVATSMPQYSERSTARELVITYPGFSSAIMPADPLFHGAVADVQTSCALFSVAELRRAIEDSQRDIIERAMFPFLRRKPAQIEPSRELAIKDAQPLWERAQILRQETESEEEITFRNLQLGYDVQRDLISRGILQINPENKLLMVGPVSPAPAYYADAIQFAFRAERLVLESTEETERMDLIDESWVTKTDILALFFDTAPVTRS